MAGAIHAAKVNETSICKVGGGCVCKKGGRRHPCLSRLRDRGTTNGPQCLTRCANPRPGRHLAPQAGFEPATNRLTADRSTTELLRSIEGRTPHGNLSVPSSHPSFKMAEAPIPFADISGSRIQATRPIRCDWEQPAMRKKLVPVHVDCSIGRLNSNLD